MAKGMYIGVDGKARKVKKMYFGVGGVARKVKKAYIGVGGVARLFFSGGELAYYGEITSFNYAAGQRAATAGNNDYALFAGGYTTKAISLVWAYDKSLTQSYADNLKEPSTDPFGISAFGYGIFVNPSYEYLDLYNGSLTHTKNYSAAVTLPNSVSRSNFAGATVGNYLFFAGGHGPTDVVDVCDSSFTKLSNLKLSQARKDLAGASTSNHAVFAGGHYNSDPCFKTVDAFDTSLTRTTPATLATATTYMAGLSLAGSALFAGGSEYAPTYHDTVYRYNASLTRSMLASLIEGRHKIASGNLGDYGLFIAGMQDSSATICSHVEAFDGSFTMTSNLSTSTNACDLETANAGKYLLAGAGQRPNASGNPINSAVVEAFVLA